MLVYVEAVECHGTIGFGYGRTEDGREVSVAIDHRMAQDIIAAIEDEGEAVPVTAEDWQVA